MTRSCSPAPIYAATKPARVRQARAQWHANRTPGLRAGLLVAAAAAAVALSADCTSQPLIAHSVDTPPLVLTTARQAGVDDKRALSRGLLRRARSRWP